MREANRLPSYGAISGAAIPTVTIVKEGSSYVARKGIDGEKISTSSNFSTICNAAIAWITGRGTISIKDPGVDVIVPSTITVTDKSIHIYGNNTVLDFSALDNIVFRFRDTSGHAVLDCGIHDFQCKGAYMSTSQIFAKFEDVIATATNIFTLGSTDKVYCGFYLYGNCSWSQISNCRGQFRNFVIILDNGADDSDNCSIFDNNLDLAYEAGEFTYFLQTTDADYCKVANNTIKNSVYGITAETSKYMLVTGNNMTGGVTAISLGVSCDFSTVIGNVIMDGYADFNAIYIDSAYGTSIVGNIIYSVSNVGFIGIKLNTIRRVLITGNEIYIAGTSATNYGIYDAGTSQEVLIVNNIITSESSYNYTGIRIVTSLTDGHIAFNEIRNCTGTPISVGATSNGFIFRNTGYKTQAEGATATVADGGAINHGLVGTPTGVVVSTSVSAEFASVITLDTAHFHVAIKKHDGSAGTTQTIYWYAWI